MFARGDRLNGGLGQLFVRKNRLNEENGRINKYSDG